MKRHSGRKATYRPNLELLEDRALLAAGQLDETFGTGGFDSDGFVTTKFDGNSAFATAIAIDGFDRIVAVGGNGNDFAIARYLPNGELDQSFGLGGKITTDFGGIESASAVAIQDDNKIVVVGTTGFDHLSVARYLENGRLDDSFDGDGRFAGIGREGISTGSAVAIQDNGQILVGGIAATDDLDFLLVRLNTDGARDMDFGNQGVVTTGFGGSADRVTGLVIQPDDKIILAGNAREPESPNSSIALARFEFNGELDLSFGVDDDDGDGTLEGDGQVHDVVRGNDAVRAVTLDGDDRIIIAGLIDDQFGLTRYTTTGERDNSFGDAGRVRTDLIRGGRAEANDVVVQENGKIIAVGSWRDEGETHWIIARYQDNGSLDTSFTPFGYVGGGFGFGGDTDWATAVALQSSGHIVIAGRTNFNYPPHSLSIDFGLARFRGDPYTFRIRGGTLFVSPNDVDVARLQFTIGGLGDVKVLAGEEEFTFTDIRQIVIDSGGGDDQVAFTVDDLRTPMDVQADLGGGHDQFTVTTASASADDLADDLVVGQDPSKPGRVLLRRTNLTPFSVALDNTEQVTLATQAGNDHVFIHDLTDTVLGSLFVDGGLGNDLIDGSAQASAAIALTLDGGAGIDKLRGGTGKDVLKGGGNDLAVDLLFGGGGADLFIVDLLFGGLDLTLDLNLLEGDRIEIA